ncbi:MAG: dUTP diphosphatase [Actinomycetia bacterium]|nr:dUTP diphosphatase [Actinomycetes bacterium]
MDTGEIILNITRLDGAAKLPTYAHAGDAGLDLYSIREIRLQPFERALIPTGIAIALPDGYAGLVVPRSGLAVKQGLSLVNTPGMIDSGYRGEIKVCAINLDPKESITLAAGDRIAQLVITPYAHAQLFEVNDLNKTSRGEGGFGSSGMK